MRSNNHLATEGHRRAFILTTSHCALLRLLRISCDSRNTDNTLIQRDSAGHHSKGTLQVQTLATRRQCGASMAQQAFLRFIFTLFKLMHHYSLQKTHRANQA